MAIRLILSRSAEVSASSDEIQRLVKTALPYVLSWIYIQIRTHHKSIKTLFENGSITPESSIDAVTQGDRDNLRKGRWTSDHEAAAAVIRKMTVKQWESLFRAKFKKTDAQLLADRLKTLLPRRNQQGLL